MPPACKNVLFITGDQWRGDTLGAVGHPCVQTPNLDRLAAGGTLFRNHFTQATPCGPARASLLTGLYLMNHRSVVNGTPLDARHPNLAREARRAGYDPTLFGYTDTTIDPRTVAPDDPRLRTYEELLPGFTPGLHLRGDALPWIAWLAKRGHRPDHDGDSLYWPRGVPQGRCDGPSAAPALFAAEHSDTAFLTDRALDWLASQGERSWFLHLSYLRPHPPWIAPEPYATLYGPDQVPGPTVAGDLEREAEQHPLHRRYLETDKQSTYFPTGAGPVAALDEAQVRQLRATYYGLITELDAHIGRVLDVLDSSGQARDTLVVFTSDHGEQLGDHYRFGKGGYFDGAYHVPLIIRDPAKAHRGPGRGGQVVTAFSEAVDIVPTILDWIGRPCPPQCDGESLLPLLDGPAPADWRRDVFWENDFRDVRDFEMEHALSLAPDQCNLSVLRDERYKYVHFAALPPLLFDLQADPRETRDLAEDPAHAGVMLEMAQRLLSRRMIHAERTLTNMHAGPGGFVTWQGARRASRGPLRAPAAPC